MQKSAKKYGKNKNSVYWMIENVERSKKNRKKQKKTRKIICSVKKDEAAGDCWPADAGMEDVDSRKALYHVKRADGRTLAGQAGRKAID